MRILVVDDQVTTGVSLCRTLEAHGHETSLVTGAAAAWDALSRDDWRLILTDWVMPEVDGLELCRLIRSRAAVPYRYIIMLTVQDQRWHKLEALRAGADDFLIKPVDEEELITRLAIAERILDVQVDLERKNAHLAQLASLDPLTGLANRRALMRMLEGLPSGEGRGLPYSIASLDIDHFKSYNDRFGHQAGDEALRLVAEILSAVARAGRPGGANRRRGVRLRNAADRAGAGTGDRRETAEGDRRISVALPGGDGEHRRRDRNWLTGGLWSRGGARCGRSGIVPLQARRAEPRDDGRLDSAQAV